jgi:hypothetical protein
MYPEGYHSIQLNRRLDLKRRAKQEPNAVAHSRYYLINRLWSVISVMWGPHEHDTSLIRVALTVTGIPHQVLIGHPSSLVKVWEDQRSI